MKRHLLPIIATVFLWLPIVSAKESNPDHEAQTGSTAPQNMGDIARGLAVRGQLVTLPSKGTARQSLKKENPLFKLPTGESRVALFKLPEYSAPYTVLVMSTCKCFGLSKSIFVPTGTFFDGEFQPTRELAKSAFALEDSGSRPYRLEATVLIDEARRGDAYLLLYTTPGDVGQVVGNPARALIKTKLTNVKASAEGSLELEVRPAVASSRAPEEVPDRPKEPVSGEHTHWSFGHGQGPGEAEVVMFGQFSAPRKELVLGFACAMSEKKWNVILEGRDHTYLMHTGIWYRFDEPETAEAFDPTFPVKMPDKSKAIAILDENLIRKMLTHHKVCFSVVAWQDESAADRKEACPGPGVPLKFTGTGASKGKTGVYIDGEFSLEGLREMMLASHCGERHLEKMLGKEE